MTKPFHTKDWQSADRLGHCVAQQVVGSVAISRMLWVHCWQTVIISPSGLWERPLSLSAAVAAVAPADLCSQILDVRHFGQKHKMKKMNVNMNTAAGPHTRSRTDHTGTGPSHESTPTPGSCLLGPHGPEDGASLSEEHRGPDTMFTSRVSSNLTLWCKGIILLKGIPTGHMWL